MPHATLFSNISFFVNMPVNLFLHNIRRHLCSYCLSAQPKLYFITLMFCNPQNESNVYHKIHICVHYCFSGSDDRSIVTYNGEVCPICLGVPKIGVRAPCGHSLCAECLANYCDVRIAPAPPPCPLCRAPLNSVALTCDFVSITCVTFTSFAKKSDSELCWQKCTKCKNKR